MGFRALERCGALAELPVILVADPWPNINLPAAVDLYVYIYIHLHTPRNMKIANSAAK